MALVVKNPPANAGNISDTGSKRSLGEAHGNPLQYSCLENLMDRGAWHATVQSAQFSHFVMSDSLQLYGPGTSVHEILQARIL